MRQIDWHYDIHFRLNEAGDAFMVHCKRSAEEKNGAEAYQMEAATRELHQYEVNVLASLTRFLQQNLLEENKSLRAWDEENKQKDAAAAG